MSSVLVFYLVFYFPANFPVLRFFAADFYLSFVPFFLSGFFLRTFMSQRTGGEERGYLFNSSLPLTPTSQTLRQLLQRAHLCTQLAARLEPGTFGFGAQVANHQVTCPYPNAIFLTPINLFIRNSVERNIKLVKVLFINFYLIVKSSQVILPPYINVLQYVVRIVVGRCGVKSQHRFRMGCVNFILFVCFFFHSICLQFFFPFPSRRCFSCGWQKFFRQCYTIRRQLRVSRIGLANMASHLFSCHVLQR